MVSRRERGTAKRVAPIGAAALAAVLLAGCSGKFAGTVDPKYGVSSSPRVVADGQPVPRGGGVYRVGKPYTVAGRTYVPSEDKSYSAVGLASWYGPDFHGRLTANGEVFDMNAISAAHPTLPMPSYVRVTNLSNQKSIVVRVNDRGPYHGNRVIDVSVRTARLLGFFDQGVTRVKVDYVGRAPLEGSDDRMLMATLRDGAPAPAPGVMVASADPDMPLQPRPRRHAVPLPDDRPFNLGEDEPDAPAASPAPRNAVARAVPEPSPAAPAASRVTVATVRAKPVGFAPSKSFDNRWQAAVPSSGTLAPPAPAFGALANAMPAAASAEPAAAATPGPVSAYAPARYAPAPGYMSGRGLY